MAGLVSTSVINAILAGSTSVTRRAEIYEADGVTPFNLHPRVKDGNVSVDYSRVDRRNFDLTLDNSEGLLVHDPVHGLWYDKVIKIYRGLNYQNTKMHPSIALLEVDATSAAAIIPALRRTGFTDLTFFPTVTGVAVADLLRFDIIIGYAVDTNISVASAALLAGAYAAGKNVLSVCNYADATTVPLIATTSTRNVSVLWDMNPPTYDNLFASAFQAYSASYTLNETIPATVTGSTRIAATTTFGGIQVPSMLAGQSVSGGQWLHYHPKINLALTPASNVALFLALFQAGINWLYSYGGTQTYETQVGQFCIDKISEPRFPHEIKISGRDYAKRLSLSKFDQTVTFVAGTSVDYLIRAEAANGGIFNLKLAGTGQVLPGDLTFSRSSDRLAALTLICASVNQEIFFDSFGYLVTRLFLDPALAPISLYLNLGGVGANVITMDKSSDDSLLFNRIICTGASASTSVQGLVYEGIAENHEPSSPTRIERLGERTNAVDMPTFTSDAQCLDWAKRVLKVSALESYNLNYASLVFPWLEAGEITQYVDSVNSIAPTRYLMTSFNVPLGVTSQSGTAKRISIVG
jgi:hypothetical protein